MGMGKKKRESEHTWAMNVTYSKKNMLGDNNFCAIRATN